MAALSILLNTNLPRIQPPYGSALIFELRQDDAKKYYVRLMAKFNAINEPISFQEVKISGNCSSFKIYLSIFNPKFPLSSDYWQNVETSFAHWRNFWR